MYVCILYIHTYVHKYMYGCNYTNSGIQAKDVIPYDFFGPNFDISNYIFNGTIEVSNVDITLNIFIVSIMDI
jgi:hypothetical protein